MRNAPIGVGTSATSTGSTMPGAGAGTLCQLHRGSASRAVTDARGVEQDGANRRVRGPISGPIGDPRLARGAAVQARVRDPELRRPLGEVAVFLQHGPPSGARQAFEE